MSFDPDRFAPLLRTKSLGRHLRHLPSVTSTMDVARDLVSRATPHGALVIADEQTSGRGRRGSRWLSAKDCGLWFSLLLRPSLPPAVLPIFSPVAALAIASVINDRFNLPARTKWPNDVLLHDRKLAGVLIEILAQPVRVLIGVGLNLRLPPDAPPELVGTMTALDPHLKRPADREALLAEILARLEDYLERCESGNTEALLGHWGRLDLFHRSPVRVVLGDTTVSGIDIGISFQGHLLLQTPERTIAIPAGEIVTLRPR